MRPRKKGGVKMEADTTTPANVKIDDKFIYLTKRIKVRRDCIKAVKPYKNGNGAHVLMIGGGIHVRESYSEIMQALHGVGTLAERNGESEHARKVSALVEALHKTDEAAAQILEALRRCDGTFSGTATDMVFEISKNTGHAAPVHVFTPRIVGRAINRNLDVFEKLFLMQEPRLRNGMSYYRFYGLRQGVEW